MDDSLNTYIALLNNYKNSTKSNYFEVLDIINISNSYYNLYLKTNQKEPPPPNPEIPTIKKITVETQTPQFSLEMPKEYLYQGDEILFNDYIKKRDEKKEENDAIMEEKAIIEEKMEIDKEKIVINDAINNIGDLLKILNTYPLDDTKEYNIDLGKLHLIKPELEELNQMIGMESLKSSIIDQLFYFLQDLHLIEGDGGGGDFKHTVICGPPGTGKTEIAKIIGRMFSKIGILKKNTFKKVVRNDLVAGYLGQTAIKTKAVINECLGGVLFIDEAYSLAAGSDNDSFSHECINILCEALSNHKDDLMVIVAGYEEEMKMFFKTNRGLDSRFIWRFKIDNYSPLELSHIYVKKIRDAHWSFSTDDVGLDSNAGLDSNVGLDSLAVLDSNAVLDSTKVLDKWFSNKKNDFVHFGRDMEILFLYTKICHARRIYGKTATRKNITIVDLENGFKMFNKHNSKVETVKYPYLYL